MTMPLWFVLSITAALITTATPLVQEKFKADGFALAFWVKVFVAALIAPMVMHDGLPTAWQFYAYLGVTAAIYAVSDIFYFRAVPVVGSGIVTRILPASVVLTFFGWFLVDPDLIHTYAATPWKMAAILSILALFTFCATQVKKCAVTWQGVRLVWPVIFAACTGPIVTKLGLAHAGAQQAASSYVFVQALMMVLLLGISYAIRKPVPRRTFLARHTLQTAFILGAISVVTVYMKTRAIQLVDNPGFVSMVMFTDALWVICVYRLIGKKENAKVWAGLGIVLCALAVVAVKSF